MEELLLVRPDMTFAAEIMAFRAEFLAAGSSMDGCGGLRHCWSAGEYIARCEKNGDPANVPPGCVPDTQFMLVRAADRRVLGMLQVRDAQNEYLRTFGGNIGYSVRPSERRKGYAKEMLRMALEVCREMGFARVMISCIDGNIASEKTILACGGAYETTVFETKDQVAVKRFWIEL